MAVILNFELASRSVPNRSYEARRKPRPLIESLRYMTWYDARTLLLFVPNFNSCMQS